MAAKEEKQEGLVVEERSIKEGQGGRRVREVERFTLSRRKAVWSAP